MMGFAELRSGDVHLTAAGRALAEADIGGRKRLFADHLLRSACGSYSSGARRAAGSRGASCPVPHRTGGPSEYPTTPNTRSAPSSAGGDAEVFAYDHPRRMFSLPPPL